MVTPRHTLLLLVLLFLPALAPAQTYNTTGNYVGRNTRYRARLAVPYFNQGAYARTPYGRTALATPVPALPPVSGPINKYSPIEYGEIVKMTVEAARRNNPMADLTTSHSTIVVETSATEAATGPVYAPVTTKVSDVLDRGVLLLPTGEELRLRGVAIPSTTDKNEVNRLYAKEAIQVLRNLTQGKDIYVLLDIPLRDGSGHLLGTIILADGTELNRRMIGLGYGTVHEDDFGPDVDFQDLTIAQTEARDKRLGIWSANF